jgi:hypothetical protein
MLLILRQEHPSKLGSTKPKHPGKLGPARQKNGCQVLDFGRLRRTLPVPVRGTIPQLKIPPIPGPPNPLRQHGFWPKK